MPGLGAGSRLGRPQGARRSPAARPRPAGRARGWPSGRLGGPPPGRRGGVPAGRGRRPRHRAAVPPPQAHADRQRLEGVLGRGRPVAGRPGHPRPRRLDHRPGAGASSALEPGDPAHGAQPHRRAAQLHQGCRVSEVLRRAPARADRQPRADRVRPQRAARLHARDLLPLLEHRQHRDRPGRRGGDGQALHEAAGARGPAPARPARDRAPVGLQGPEAADPRIRGAARGRRPDRVLLDGLRRRLRRHLLDPARPGDVHARVRRRRALRRRRAPGPVQVRRRRQLGAAGSGTPGAAGWRCSATRLAAARSSATPATSPATPSSPLQPATAGAR